VYISPIGIGGREVNDLLYMLCDAGETLLEQLDTDALTDSDYESTCFDSTAIHYSIENSKGSVIGPTANSVNLHTSHYSQKELVDILYSIVYALSLTTAKLDADGTVTDTDYTSLWYTNTILLTVENSSGDRIGN
jgi:hypothetical protein